MQRMGIAVLHDCAFGSLLACCVQAKAAAEAQSFSAAAVGQPYLSFQKKRTEVIRLPQRALPARRPE